MNSKSFILKCNGVGINFIYGKYGKSKVFAYFLQNFLSFSIKTKNIRIFNDFHFFIIKRSNRG